MHQILEKCRNMKSVAKVYELKSEPSYLISFKIVHQDRRSKLQHLLSMTKGETEMTAKDRERKLKSREF